MAQEELKEHGSPRALSGIAVPEFMACAGDFIFVQVIR